MEQNPSTQKQQQAVPLRNETWRLAWQTFINILIGTVISIIVVISLSSLMVGSIWGKLVVEFICLAITLPIVYGYMWGQGDRDANFIQFGRMQPAPLKGLWAGLLGIIPWLLTSILLALSMLEIIPFDFLPIYRLLNAPMWGFINMLHPNGGAIPHAGVPAQPATDTMPAIEAVPPTDGLSWGAFWIIFLLPFIYTAFCAVGYYLGTKRLSIINKVVYKNDPEKIAAHRNKKRKH